MSVQFRDHDTIELLRDTSKSSKRLLVVMVQQNREYQLFRQLPKMAMRRHGEVRLVYEISMRGCKK